MARLGACLEKKRLRDQEQAHLEALHSEKERLSVTLRSLADAVVTTDSEGRIVLLNDVGVAFTGMDRAVATGRPFAEVFRIFHRANGEPAGDIAIEALKRNSVVESGPSIAIMPPDGIERLLSVRCAPIHDHEGKINGTVVVLRDITEKEKMAEELLRSSKLQSIGVLAGGLAHDFNNMLTAVTGNLSLIRQQENLQPEAYCSIDEAEQGARRAQELTQYLLTFAEGGAPIKQVIQVRALIQQTSAFVVRGSNVTCEFELAPNLLKIEADPNQIAQVISNIVLNAVEATPNGGRICVKAGKRDGSPRLRALPGGGQLPLRLRAGPGHRDCAGTSFADLRSIFHNQKTGAGIGAGGGLLHHPTARRAYLSGIQDRLGDDCDISSQGIATCHNSLGAGKIGPDQSPGYGGPGGGKNRWPETARACHGRQRRHTHRGKSDV